MSSESKSSSGTLGFLAGALAGLVGDGIVHPVDTIRTRLQAQRTVVYSGMIDAFTKTVSKEGFSVLYKGFGAVAAMTTPAHALYFGGYEASKLILQPSRKEEEKSAWVHFASGLFADVCGSIIWVPMDIIKQKLQNSGNVGRYRNSVHVVQVILKEEGIRGIYRGAPVAIATFGPYVGLYFTLYEQFKTSIAKYLQLNRDNLSMPMTLAAAFTASSISALVTCPIDVVKTNMQVYSVREGGHSNTLHTIRELYASGGLRVFMRGWNARILWMAPGTSITIAAYEQCKAAITFLTS